VVQKVEPSQTNQRSGPQAHESIPEILAKIGYEVYKQ